MPHADPIVLKAYYDHYRKTHPAAFSEYYQQYAQSIKAKCFALFGSKCAKCGFSDIRALQLDHINGNGNQERKATKLEGHRLYKAIVHGKRSTEGLQALCANCDASKKIENHEHRYRESWKRKIELEKLNESTI